MCVEDRRRRSGDLLTRTLSLPHELVQSVLSSIANFEPWTYGSVPRRDAASLTDGGLTDEDLTDEVLTLGGRDAEPLNLSSMNWHILGLSSQSDWLMMVLARHPYHLSRRDTDGVSAAITQALRRMNARIERAHWEERTDTAEVQIQRRFGCAQTRDVGSRTWHNDVDERNPLISESKPVSMKQYHATVQPEEEDGEAYCHEDMNGATARTAEHTSSPSTAVIAYGPAPVLKLSSLDLVHLAHQHDIRTSSAHTIAALLTISILLTQLRLAVLTQRGLEREHNATASTPPDFSTRPEKQRSLSGSTVAEPFFHEETLSFSPISTVCHFPFASTACHIDGLGKEVKWIEKRGTEGEDGGTSSKRPKLSEYRQVSSGRVASLMDRFERFHL